MKLKCRGLRGLLTWRLNVENGSFTHHPVNFLTPKHRGTYRERAVVREGKLWSQESLRSLAASVVDCIARLPAVRVGHIPVAVDGRVSWLAQEEGEH